MIRDRNTVAQLTQPVLDARALAWMTCQPLVIWWEVGDGAVAMSEEVPAAGGLRERVVHLWLKTEKFLPQSFSANSGIETSPPDI